LYCDIRFAANNAVFTTAFSRSLSDLNH